MADDARLAARGEAAFGAPLVDPTGSPGPVAAVVVTHDGVEAVRACVASLRASRGADLLTIVVDNASRPESRAVLEREFAALPDVELVLLPENRHFAGGVNAGVERALAAGAGFLFVLNDDTEIAPDCVAQLVAAAVAHPDAGVVGPALLDTRDRDRALSLGEHYSAWSLAVPRSLLRVRDPGDGTPYRVGGVMGSAVLITRECFLRTGPYREDLLVYYEEVDFCLRARRLGFRPLLVPRAVVRHDGMRGFATGLTPYAARLKTRNQLILIRDHGGLAARLAFAPVFLGLVGASSALYALRGQGPVVSAMWAGVGDGLRSLLRPGAALPAPEARR
ncbi:MAG: hypothetical protein RL698_3180 [Pseudomonadota bacterium]|jgi:GT2 family glycosyltransferase